MTIFFKIDNLFIKKIFIWNIPVLLIALVAGVYFYGNEIMTPLIWGFFLSMINILIGYFSIELSSEKKINTFFKYLISGMILRIFLLLLIIVILIKTTELNIFALIISLFIFYIINLSLEINYISNRFKKNNN